MTFNLDTFKTSLEPFGTLTYARIYDKGLPSEYIEFVVDSVEYLYAVVNLGQLVTNDILPYYPTLDGISMDRLRLKGVFRI